MRSFNKREESSLDDLETFGVSDDRVAAPVGNRDQVGLNITSVCLFRSEVLSLHQREGFQSGPSPILMKLGM